MNNISQILSIMDVAYKNNANCDMFERFIISHVRYAAFLTEFSVKPSYKKVNKRHIAQRFINAVLSKDMKEIITICDYFHGNFIIETLVWCNLMSNFNKKKLTFRIIKLLYKSDFDAFSPHVVGFIKAQRHIFESLFNDKVIRTYLCGMTIINFCKRFNIPNKLADCKF